MNNSSQMSQGHHESSALSRHPKFRYHNGNRTLLSDEVIIEQPLQIRLYWYRDNVIQKQVFSITMRTPGDDHALITGLLLAEGIIDCYGQIKKIAREVEYDEDETGDVGKIKNDEGNLWEVKLHQGHVPNINSLERYQVTYSSCGLCGTTSLKSLELKDPPLLSDEKHWLSSSRVCQMPDEMKVQQKIFQQTGGSHAAALFDQQGKLLFLHEDIGRHNAVDKVLGTKLQQQDVSSVQVPYSLVVSGRLSFEIVQKAVMSGICVLIAVGAPSDLAIVAAKRFNLTLIGFVSKGSFNLYHGEWRLRQSLQES